MVGWELHEGDALDVLRTLDAASCGALVTDPPSGTAFMNRAWDRDKGGRDQWIAWLASVLTECYRVLKPGGYALVWALPRTSHWTGMAIEDAGFRVVDSIHHLFGSGFPKSMAIDKALDKAAGATREVVGRDPHYSPGRMKTFGDGNKFGTAKGGDEETAWKTAPATELARKWSGYGTALKPAHEVWWLAQKPFDKGLGYAANVARHGVGCLDIDGCRVQGAESTMRVNRAEMGYHGGNLAAEYTTGSEAGRWPTNLLLTHHPDCNGACVPSCPVAELDRQSGTLTSGTLPAGTRRTTGGGYMGGFPEIAALRDYGGDSGGASRFYPTFRFEADDFAPFQYVAKAARSEREAGLQRLRSASPGERTGRKEGSAGLDSPRAGAGRTNAGANLHPTVKPLQLMKWLVRLVTPPGETVLDPFLGSGTTGCAAVALGRPFIGIEREAAYMAISRRRLETTQPALPLGGEA